MNDALFRHLQFLESIIAKVPEEYLKMADAIFIQEHMVKLNTLLFKAKG
jgi:predicted transcriptional regulator